MPQLNPEFFISQLFWLFISFSFLLFFLWKISLPRISTVMLARENKINNEIQEAKKLQAEAENIQKQIEFQLREAQEQSAKTIKETITNMQDKTSSELTRIDNDLNKKIEESTIAIQKNKDNLVIEINDQIKDITRLTLQKLLTLNVEDNEIKNVISKIHNNKIN